MENFNLDSNQPGQQFVQEIWARLRHVIPEIPAAVVLVSDSIGRRAKLGHFAPTAWRARGRKRHEVSISPDQFASAPALLATFLHEAAHAILYTRRYPGGARKHRLGGVGADGDYHRAEFRDQCIRLGLRCEFGSKRRGWNLTDWPVSGVPSQYSEIVAFIEQNRPLGTSRREPRKPGPKPLPKSGHVRLVCRCMIGPRSIYVSPTVVEKGGILCEYCRAQFQPPVKERKRPRARNERGGPVAVAKPMRPDGTDDGAKPTAIV